ncbi:MAG: MarR family transcriptional regulator [Gammaproteobacteria bacterium]|nr:MarR family transcriptional regulator [Gammaproteobacteria bacterium]
MSETKKTEKSPLKATNYLFYYLWHIVLESQNKIDDAMRAHDIRAPSWRVIMILHEHGSMTISEISKDVLLENSRLSRIAQNLEEKGIVQRAKCTDDQRYTRLQLTKKGRQIFEDLAPIAERQLESTLHGFSSQERKQLDQMVRRLKDNTYRSPFALP